MIEKPVEKISKDDIESLVSARVSERRSLDYKQQLPGNSTDDKREFLYDVSSFANASGGDLVFGIVDERDSAGKSTGLPSSATGVCVSNISHEIARLENLVRDGISPRIQGIEWNTVDGFQAGPVIVMRTPRSLTAPHMVIFGGMARFYSRNSTGKYPMDLGEIRSSFIESAALGEKLESLRGDRLSAVLDGSTPIGLNLDSKIVLHLIPFSSLISPFGTDITRDAARLQPLIEPIVGTSWGGRYNFDGYLVVSAGNESYTQIFRSGLIEAAAMPFRDIPEQYKNVIPGIDFERRIIHSLTTYLNIQKRLGVRLPIFTAITLLGVRNYRMSSFNTFASSHLIDRDHLRLPEILIEDYSVNLGRVLKIAFDALWQACGLEGSLNYDADGNWRQHHS